MIAGNGMHIGIAADHGGYTLKAYLVNLLEHAGHHVEDFGAYELNPLDDYPDFVIPMCQALLNGKMNRGIVICGSGVGASIAANKVPGIRAGLIHDSYSAHQGVEDDNMNVLCLGGRVISKALAWEYVQIFLAAEYRGEERFQRRLAKVAQLERKEYIK